MPHIPRADRDEAMDTPRNASELAYAISAAVAEYSSYRGLDQGVMAEVVGALEIAKLEFYRQVAADIEDENKDLYGAVFPELGP